MSLLPKIESIFFIITVFDKIEYEFEDGIVLKVPEKLVVVAIYPLVYYLIIELSNIRSLLITKLIFIGIEFEFPKKASCTYDSLAKLG